MSEGACFYRGTSTDQVAFFKDTDKKLVEQMEKKKQFPSHFAESVHMKKVSMDVLAPWIRKRITELMGIEDDIVIEYCISHLTEELPPGKKLCPKTLQMNLTGFMERKAKVFCSELWTHLLSAQDSPVGVPQSFIDMKKKELQEKKEKAEKLEEELNRRRAELMATSSQLLPPQQPNIQEQQPSLQEKLDPGRRSRSPRRRRRSRFDDEDL